MNSSSHTVTVIIPTYNRANLVCEAIDSLLAQSRVPDEIIVVDDGSTDNTFTVLQKYQSPVIVIKNHKKGRSSARNTGLKRATGSLIAFLDDDDTLPSSSIQLRVTALEAHSEYAVVYGDALLIDFEGNEISRFTGFKPGLRPSGNVFAAFAHDNLSPIHTFMFRKECLNEATFDESLDTLEDHDFWLHIASKHHFLYLNEVFAYYRTHNQMTTLNYPDLMRSNHLKVQLRAITIPAFQQIQPQEQALVYYGIGAAQVMLGQTSEARGWLKKAVRLSPSFWRAYLLIVLSLFSNHTIQTVAQVRRNTRALIQKNTRWIYNR